MKETYPLRHQKKHIAPPASATEILRDIKITKKDLKIVTNILRELFPKEFPEKD